MDVSGTVGELTSGSTPSPIKSSIALASLRSIAWNPTPAAVSSGGIRVTARPGTSTVQRAAAVPRRGRAPPMAQSHQDDGSHDLPSPPNFGWTRWLPLRPGESEHINPRGGITSVTSRPSVSASRRFTLRRRASWRRTCRDGLGHGVPRPKPSCDVQATTGEQSDGPQTARIDSCCATGRPRRSSPLPGTASCSRIRATSASLRASASAVRRKESAIHPTCACASSRLFRSVTEYAADPNAVAKSSARTAAWRCRHERLRRRSPRRDGACSGGPAGNWFSRSSTSSIRRPDLIVLTDFFDGFGAFFV